MDFTRARPGADPPIVPIHQLTTKQRALVEAVDDFQRATGEPCSAGYLARRFAVHHTTVRERLSALYRKGWLRSPNAPVSLRRSPRE